MKALWWSCVLGFLCMPAEMMVSPWTVSQTPPAISLVSLNSSAEISCSTSMPDPWGLYLNGQFHGDRQVMYLSLEKGEVKQATFDPAFTGRIDVVADRSTRQGRGFTLHLSLLGLQDTDMYYCKWTYFNATTSTPETLQSSGTIVIVRERDPYKQCDGDVVDLILIILSMAAFIIILFLFIGALIFRCTRFKKHYRPARATSRSKPNRHQNACPHHRDQQIHYLGTSSDNFDFRGIL